MKFILTCLFAILFLNIVSSQTTINQNGLETTVISQLSADATQAKRFEIANVGYNSHHWQYGGIITIEIYQVYYSTDYKKYIIQNGYGSGTIIKLVESHGNTSNGRIVSDSPIDLTSTWGGYVNRLLPIFLDVKYYGVYNVKITYTQQKVDVLDAPNQIKINETPVGTSIPDFTVSNELNNDQISNSLLAITADGNHYIKNGNVGIGTTVPDEKLTVKGKIHTQEVKVDLLGPLVPDYVFANDYKLKSLEEVEAYIKQNSHLPEIPSAKEIEKNGLMLAEMNMSLLKKIEELTLYSIDQNKKIEIQAKEIEALKDLMLRVSKIENELARK